MTAPIRCIHPLYLIRGLVDRHDESKDGTDHLWLCCYLPGTGVASDRVAFDVTIRDGTIAFELAEMPEGSISVEPSHP